MTEAPLPGLPRCVERRSRTEGDIVTPLPYAFHLLAKPTGAICNLNCEYCFFLSKEELYPGSSFRMRDEVMEAYIQQQLEAQPAAEVVLPNDPELRMQLLSPREPPALDSQKRAQPERQLERQPVQVPERSAARFFCDFVRPPGAMLSATKFIAY